MKARNIILILVLALGIPTVLVIGGIGAAVYFGYQAMQNNYAYRSAVLTVQQSENAQAILGDNIEAEGPWPFQYNSVNGRATVTMDFVVKGSKGQGTVRVNANNHSGQWVYTQLDLISGGKQLDLNPDLQLAPK